MRNRSTPPGDVIPVLIYDDPVAASDWLCRVFGLAERLRAGRGHVQLAVGEGSVILGASRVGQGFDTPDTAVFREPRSDEVSQLIHVRVADVDAHHARAVEAGATILQPPATHPYGERQYTACDPAGHRWTFSQSVEDVDPADWGAISPGGSPAPG